MLKEIKGSLKTSESLGWGGTWGIQNRVIGKEMDTDIIIQSDVSEVLCRQQWSEDRPLWQPILAYRMLWLSTVWVLCETEDLSKSLDCSSWRRTLWSAVSNALKKFVSKCWDQLHSCEVAPPLTFPTGRERCWSGRFEHLCRWAIRAGYSHGLHRTIRTTAITKNKYCSIMP